ncbi:hypothetical protein Y032_0473g2104 [Ancylostoma ceylanicum]|uniref:Reverse transcriptase domain-containing protein n=1 Tax=Ancylostoma ceylanicum TaxID=53326 RepID=A0A016WWP9_9BILA|nr:hypothetical protein Y032_0473g2104 [Ancylostoma ceylanicum]
MQHPESLLLIKHDYTFAVTSIGVSAFSRAFIIIVRTSAVSQHEDIRTHNRPPSPRHHPTFNESVWFRSQLRDDGCDPCGTPADRKTPQNRNKQKPLHLAFLDLEKVFDRVPHEVIWYALRWHGVPEELIEWVRILYADPRSRVQAAAGTSAEFPISVGVHQGSALSPLLFILVMDAITRDLQRSAPWTLLYADDVMLTSEQKEDLERQTQAWSERLARFSLRLNVKKTEYMMTNLDEHSTIQVDGNDIRRTDYFKYLGSTLSADGNLAHEVVARVNAAWLKGRSTTGVLCDKNIPGRFKSKVYRTVVRSVALYGADCWPATEEAERRLNVMETKMLRWTAGSTRADRIRNEKIRERFGIAPIADKLRETRLRWYGHVLRANEDTICKVGLDLGVPGKRPRGRPKHRG